MISGKRREARAPAAGDAATTSSTGTGVAWASTTAAWMSVCETAALAAEAISSVGPVGVTTNAP